MNKMKKKNEIIVNKLINLIFILLLYNERQSDAKK